MQSMECRWSLASQPQAQGIHLLTESQKEWVEWMSTLVRAEPCLEPPPVSSRFRQWCRRLALNPVLPAVMMGVVLANVGVLASDHAYPSDAFVLFQRIMEVCVNRKRITVTLRWRTVRTKVKIRGGT